MASLRKVLEMVQRMHSKTRTGCHYHAWNLAFHFQLWRRDGFSNTSFAVLFDICWLWWIFLCFTVSSDHYNRKCQKRYETMYFKTRRLPVPSVEIGIFTFSNIGCTVIETHRLHYFWHLLIVTNHFIFHCSKVEGNVTPPESVRNGAKRCISKRIHAAISNLGVFNVQQWMLHGFLKHMICNTFWHLLLVVTNRFIFHCS